MSKNFYSVLGLSVDAPDFLIQAAYRAMVKKYHPDVFDGDRATAEKKIREINEAYETLSSPEKKQQYDSSFIKTPETSAEEFHEKDFWQIKIPDWEVVETYYPEIEDIRSELQKLSEEISILFQLLMVEHKEYERADFYSEQLKSYYLTKYFGDKSLAHKFAEKLLNSGLRKVALELNRDIRVLGAEHSDAIVSRLKKKYFSEIYGRSVEEMGEWADYLEEHLLNFEFESDDDISLSFERSFSEKTLTFIFNANIFRKSNSGIFKTDQLILEFEVDLFNLQVKASYAGKFDLRKADFLSDYESDQDLFEFFKTHIKFAFR